MKINNKKGQEVIEFLLTYGWFIILILGVIFVYLVYFNNLTTNTLTKEDKQVMDCSQYNFSKHFDMVKGFTLMSDYTIKNTFILNETNTTYICSANVRMCFDSLRMCWDGSLYSQSLNKTII